MQKNIFLTQTDVRMKGNLDSALFYIKKLVEKYPNSYESYNELGVIYGSRNELKLAEKLLKNL